MTDLRYCLSVLLLIVTASSAFADDESSKKKTAAGVPDRAALEKAFAEKMSGAALVGRYSVDGQKDDKPPRPERYELAKVSKLKGDYWVFSARIKYGKYDLTVPIRLKVLWAGDTPVITLTNQAIPGLGTFTARVMFYGDRYVGTWQHGKVGGHMWGQIEKAKKAEDADANKNNSK